MSKLKKITTPGLILRKDYLIPMGMTQEAFAKHLGGSWTQPKVNKTLNGERAVTAEDALDFADALGVDPRELLAMQAEVDIAKALESHEKVRRIQIK